jgi:5-methyltetrahydrofolate--homocysteine methyltransferase
VSVFYYSYPKSQYSTVGKLNKNQVEDIAKRKGFSVEEAERWLVANLGYEPD